MLATASMSLPRPAPLVGAGTPAPPRCEVGGPTLDGRQSRRARSPPPAASVAWALAAVRAAACGASAP
eukprot:6791211-Pyramimonas_sp.AAC.1